MGAAYGDGPADRWSRPYRQCLRARRAPGLYPPVALWAVRRGQLRRGLPESPPLPVRTLGGLGGSRGCRTEAGPEVFLATGYAAVDSWPVHRHERADGRALVPDHAQRP